MKLSAQILRSGAQLAGLVTVLHLPASMESSESQVLIELDCEKKTKRMK